MSDDPRSGSLRKLLDSTRRRAAAIAELEVVYRAVFGEVGDEPNVYADYDSLREMQARMRQAMEDLR